MAFATRTLKDTTHTATVICDFTNESSGGTAVDASGLAGHNDGAKLSISHIWYGISHAADDGATITFQGSSSHLTAITVAGTGEYAGPAISNHATNATATSGDISIAGTGACTGFIVLELKKDANFDDVE